MESHTSAVATLVTEPIPDRPWGIRAALACGRAANCAAGLFCLVCGLSLMAAVPVVQFLSLGYMLEASGRVARSGRLRDGVFGLDVALRLGTICVCSWLLFLPVRFLSQMARSSRLIHGDDASDDPWAMATGVLVALVLGHIAWACYRGGRVRDFVWPAPVRLWHELRSGELLTRFSDRFWSYAALWNVPDRFRLGLIGFLGGFFWLAPPVTLLVIAAQSNGVEGVAIWTVGALFLAWSIPLVPSLQTRFAMTGDWRALWDVRAIQTVRRRAPLMHLVALTLLLTLALPLYLLKAELIPREAAWLPNVLFVASIYPAKLVVGWSTYFGLQRCADASFIWRWTAAALIAPVIAAYIVVVYATQYTSWYGLGSLYEQHAFLLPVPFWQW